MGVQSATITEPTATDRDRIAVSQTPSGAGDLTLTANLEQGEATLIGIYGGSDESGKTFTVTGTDANSRVMTEVITGPNATTTYGAKYFKTVSKIAVSAATTGAVEAGVSIYTSASKILRSNWRSSDYGVGFGCVISIGGAMTYTVQHTFDDVTKETEGETWFNHSDIAAKTANADGNYAYRVQGYRVITTAYTSGSVTGKFVEN
jgi:hypothetical protein